jgi:hypothetical protein
MVIRPYGGACAQKKKGESCDVSTSKMVVTGIIHVGGSFHLKISIEVSDLRGFINKAISIPLHIGLPL